MSKAALLRIGKSKTAARKIASELAPRELDGAALIGTALPLLVKDALAVAMLYEGDGLEVDGEVDVPGGTSLPPSRTSRSGSRFSRLCAFDSRRALASLGTVTGTSAAVSARFACDSTPHRKGRRARSGARQAAQRLRPHDVP